MMHRLVAERAGLQLNGYQIDHRDINGLNNRKGNLRVATKSQNRANIGLPVNSTSGHKGVTWDAATQKWRARIGVDGSRIHLGLFDFVIEAARAYNAAAIKHFGEFACLNPV